MKRSLRIVVLFPLLFLMACAPRITIMLDGRPVPEYTYTLNNPQTGLSMEVTVAKYTKQYESGELVLWPVYLKVNKTYSITPADTSYIKITVKVRNPNKAWYELNENVLVEPQFGKIKGKILTMVVYRGKLRYNAFEIVHSIGDGKAKNINIGVKGKGDFQIFTVGDFSYKIVNEGRDAEQEGM